MNNKQIDFFNAIINNNISVVKDLCDSDVVNTQTEDGWTPAMYAVQGNRKECLKALCEVSGFNPNLQDKDGSTVAMYAIGYGSIDCLDILHKGSCIDIEVKNKWGMTAMDVACKKHNIAAMEILWDIAKERGAFDPQTPLFSLHVAPPKSVKKQGEENSHT